MLQLFPLGEGFNGSVQVFVSFAVAAKEGADAIGDDLEVDVVDRPENFIPGLGKFQDGKFAARPEHAEYFRKAFFQVFKIPDAKCYGNCVKGIVGELNSFAIALAQADMFLQTMFGDFFMA